jgi:hypothetical protein
VHSVKLVAGGARDDREEGLLATGITAFGEDGSGHVYATTLGGSVVRLISPRTAAARNAATKQAKGTNAPR